MKKVDRPGPELLEKRPVVGCGIVEAANKVHQRMKRAGMRWSIEGGVLTFRAISDRFDAAWRAMTETHAANENQVPDAIAA